MTIQLIVDEDEARENGHPPCELTFGEGLRVREILIPDCPPGPVSIPVAKYEAAAHRMAADFRRAFPNRFP